MLDLHECAVQGFDVVNNPKREIVADARLKTEARIGNADLLPWHCAVRRHFRVGRCTAIKPNHEGVQATTTHDWLARPVNVRDLLLSAYALHLRGLISFMYHSPIVCLPMLQHILYCNDDTEVLVLDLPTSIAHAQDSSQLLRSTLAPETPYVTPEPKGRKKDVLQAAVPECEREYHTGIQEIIRATLALLHEHCHQAIWYRPRISYDTEPQFSLNSTCINHCGGQLAIYGTTPPLILSPGLNSLCCSSAFVNSVVHNPFPYAVHVAWSDQGQFVVPALSTSLCASIVHGLTAFKIGVGCLLPAQLFDLVVLDPPWTNRSVRNSRAYQSAEYQQLDPFEEVFSTVSTYLKESGYVAIWITNKAAIRSRVLQICSNYYLVLVAEWVWLKVTTKGEPITPLDGLWRHPYEILLLFRRSSNQHMVTRKVVIAVPDIHSRKPSLKSAFEQLLPPRYDALEVFARSLTAGWWSWGDEVLKFQHESNWQ